MDAFNLQYQIAQTSVRVTIIGVSPPCFDGSLESFLENNNGVSHSVVVETYWGDSNSGPDFRELVSQHQLDTTTKHWIDLSSQKWNALFNEQDSRLVLFLKDPSVFPEAYNNTLSFLFKLFTKDTGTFFHCAGIKVEDRCHLFLAPSGTGKTTLSLCAQKSGWPVLSDEMVFVSKNGDHFTAYSSPFGRITDGPLEVPLGGIFFLKQGGVARFSRINPSQALARAWQDSYYRDTVLDLFGQKMRFKNRIVTPAERLRIFNLWHDLFSTIPCFEMEFPIDFDDWHRLVELVENA